MHKHCLPCWPLCLRWSRQISRVPSELIFSTLWLCPESQWHQHEQLVHFPEVGIEDFFFFFFKSVWWKVTTVTGPMRRSCLEATYLLEWLQSKSYLVRSVYAEYGFAGAAKPSSSLRLVGSNVTLYSCFSDQPQEWRTVNEPGSSCQRISRVPWNVLFSTPSDHLSDRCWWSIANAVLTFLKIETDIRDIRVDLVLLLSGMTENIFHISCLTLCTSCYQPFTCSFLCGKKP